jgi:hypothetical protein
MPLARVAAGLSPRGEVIKLPNATYNFAQIIRRNTWAGLARPAELLLTRDHVVEFNAHGPPRAPTRAGWSSTRSSR